MNTPLSAKLWVNRCGCMEQKLFGARYTEVIFSERKNVKPCGNTWAKGKMGELGYIKDGEKLRGATQQDSRSSAQPPSEVPT